MSEQVGRMLNGVPRLVDSLRGLQDPGVLSNVAPMLIVSGVGQLGQWLGSMVLANALGPAEFGRFSFGLSMCILLVTLGAYGMPILLVRTTVQGDAPQILSASVVLRLLLAACILGGGAAIVVAVVSDAPGRTMWFLWLLVPLLMAFDTTSILDGSGVARYEAYLQLARRVSYLVLVTISVVWLGQRDAATAAGAFVLSSGAFIVLQWRLLRMTRRFRIQEGLRALGPALALGTPLFISSVLVNIQAYADSFIVRWLRGSGDLGVYAAASQHFILLAGLLSLLNRVLYPSLCQAARQELEMKQAVRRMADINVVVMGLAGLGLALAAPLIVGRMLQAEYGEALPVLVILACGLPLVGLGAAYGRALLALGREDSFTAGLALGAGVDIVLNLGAIPLWGIRGAAGATVLSHAVLAVVNIVLYRRVLSAEVAVGVSHHRNGSP